MNVAAASWLLRQFMRLVKVLNGISLKYDNMVETSVVKIFRTVLFTNGNMI